MLKKFFPYFFRRAAAELISLVGCICGSAPTERLVEESVQRLENDHNRNPLTRSVRALSLGCIYRFAGGLALQGQLGRVVKVLVNEGSTIDEKAQVCFFLFACALMLLRLYGLL